MIKLYPRLKIDLKKITENSEKIYALAEESAISVTAITKVFCAIPEVAKAMLVGQMGVLGDSRIENLKNLQHLRAEKMLIRIPMLSEIDAVVRYAGISLNSQEQTLEALDQAAAKHGVYHKVMLMFDLGDLREGVFYREELIALAKKAEKLKNLHLIGIGSNLSCFGAIIPDENNLGRLVSLGEELNSVLGRELEVISGGSTSSLHLLYEKRMPRGINNLRIGEAILCGTDTSNDQKVPDVHYDCFVIEAELVEVLNKPSRPIGKSGLDAFGTVPDFPDKGVRKRAIAALGKQDYAGQLLVPLQPGVEVLGSSSDHLLLDISDAEENLKLGDIVTFIPNYGSLLALCTSSYVAKEIIR